MNRRALPTQATTLLAIVSPLCGGWAWVVTAFWGLNQIAGACVIAIGSGLILGFVIWLLPRTDVDSGLVTRYAKVALEKCEEELTFHAKDMAEEAGDQYVRACRYFEWNIGVFITQCEMRRKKDLLFLRNLDPADETKMQSKFSEVKEAVLQICREALDVLRTGATSNRNDVAAEAIANAALKIGSSAVAVNLAHKMLE